MVTIPSSRGGGGATNPGPWTLGLPKVRGPPPQGRECPPPPVEVEVGLCGGRVVDLSAWLHLSLACLFANFHAKIDLSTWLHRLLACLLAFLHVKIDLSIGGSIGRLLVVPPAPPVECGPWWGSCG